MLGDPVTENNKSEFFFVLGNFIEYTKQHPKTYGDITAEIDSDKDLALMLKEINKLGDKLMSPVAHLSRRGAGAVQSQLADRRGEQAADDAQGQ